MRKRHNSNDRRRTRPREAGFRTMLSDGLRQFEQPTQPSPTWAVFGPGRGPLGRLSPFRPMARLGIRVVRHAVAPANNSCRGMCGLVEKLGMLHSLPRRRPCSRVPVGLPQKHFLRRIDKPLIPPPQQSAAWDVGGDVMRRVAGEQLVAGTRRG